MLGAEMIGRSLALLFAFATFGCSTVHGSAFRTGGQYAPPYNGPVAVYASGKIPAGAQDLGVVEVHGAQGEAAIEELFPVFIRKVAALGGDAAVVDGVSGRFEIVTHPYMESYYYPCGWRGTCMGTRMYAVNDEVLYVSIYGHAFRSKR